MEHNSLEKFIELAAAGGVIGVIIFILSLVACTIVVQLLWTLRRRTVFPEELIAEVQRLVEAGRSRQAYQLCQNDSSLAAKIFLAGLKEADGSWSDVEKGLEDSISEETASLYRRVEYLSVIGNIAPMLGLLGTVIGMVMAFGELAASDGMGRNLAEGIYFALVTTVDGLLVAIPALLAYAMLNNRVAALSSGLAGLCEVTFRPLKRRGHPGGVPQPTGVSQSSQVSGVTVPPPPPGPFRKQ
ncbi:MAG: MotA/TolQ/ExbB proton channel family protein [Planctomycetia bacterium]|nr:MotA/TolQ/ExbB proton channel family protein [Planctomycetia bacterium]